MSNELYRAINAQEQQAFVDIIDGIEHLLSGFESDAHKYLDADFILDDKLILVIKGESSESEIEDLDITDPIGRWAAEVTDTDSEEAEVLEKETFEVWKYKDGYQPEYDRAFFRRNKKGELKYVPTPSESQAIDQINRGQTESAEEAFGVLRSALEKQSEEAKAAEEKTRMYGSRFTKERFDQIMGKLGRLGSAHLK